MKQTWFIGSTVVDVILNIDHLPTSEEDLCIQKQNLRLGGCAYNAANCFFHMHQNVRLLTPVGQGLYGKFVRENLAKQGIPLELPVTEENGCCYCLVEKSGERTFLSHHGAEYLFPAGCLDRFALTYEDAVYISGLEIEEASGDELIRFLRQHPVSILFFAPGPRLLHISPKRWRDLLNLHPYIHLNAQELSAITACANIQEAVKRLYAKSQAPIIVTFGSQGSGCYDGRHWYFYPVEPAEQVIDTIGAGDNHAGMCLLGLTKSWSWGKILTNANQYAKKVIGTSGGVLNTVLFEQFMREEFSK